MSERLPEDSNSEIPRSNLDNGLYCSGKMDISSLTPAEEARLRILDYKVWGEGKSMEGPLMRLDHTEYGEYRDLLAKCGRTLVVVDPATDFFEQ